jgi:uncharacterized protein (TIGR02391 family)
MAWGDKIGVLNTFYEGKDVGQEFGYATETSERSSPIYTFPYRKRPLQYGVDKLQSLIERLELAVGESPNIISIESLHPEIYAKCRNLYKGGDYAEAVEKSFKLVRDKLRVLTGYETGSEAFGRGNLYVDGAAAPHVDEDFQNGVKFLMMAIDRFRNEKSHTLVRTAPPKEKSREVFWLTLVCQVVPRDSARMKRVHGVTDPHNDPAFSHLVIQRGNNRQAIFYG